VSSELVAEFEKRFAGGPAIHGKLRLPADRFHVTVLLGPSGSGKTTVLRALAGLERPDSGSISFRGQSWFAADAGICLSPQDRDVGFHFQEYALFPHLTVAQNIGYGLKHLPAEEAAKVVAQLLQHFQLGELAARYPHQTSGGQQQRIALARALARRPRLLLLDEPLSALDTDLRNELRPRLRGWLAAFAIPVILVTHDRAEAAALGDQVVVMEAGQMKQVGNAAAGFGSMKT
jgi:molybdate transport system ATP-binding protein